MPMNNMSQTALRCPAKTLWVRVTGFLNLDNHYASYRDGQKPSNPYLQSFEGIFKGLIEQVRINLSCAHRSMSECLLNDEDVRGASIQPGCETVPERMWCDSFIDPSFDNPLVKAALNLSRGDSLLHLAEEERLRIGEDLLAIFKISIQDRSKLGVEKAIDDLSTFGLNGDPLLQKIDIGDVQTDELRQPDAGMQEQVDDDQVAVCLPALLRSDGFQEQAFLLLSHENWWLCILVFDLNPDGGIVIDLTDVGQPAKKAFDRCPSAIDGRIQFRLTIGLVCHWNRKKKAIDISGAYLPDFAVVAKMFEQQIQITLLGTDRMWRSAIGKLVIQKLLCCLFNYQIILLFLFVKSYVQQCSQNRMQVKVKNEINVTV